MNEWSPFITRANAFSSQCLLVSSFVRESVGRLEAKQANSFLENIEGSFSEFLDLLDANDSKEAGRKVGELIASNNIEADCITGIAGGTNQIKRFIEDPIYQKEKLLFKKDIDKLFGFMNKLVDFFDGLFKVVPSSNLDHGNPLKAYHDLLCRRRGEAPLSFDEVRKKFMDLKEQFRSFEAMSPN